MTSFYLMTRPDCAVKCYLNLLSATTEEAGSWLKSFNVEGGRSSMWQSPMYPLTIHLVQVGGCAFFCLGLILLASTTIGSAKRFTEGSCLLLALTAYCFLLKDDVMKFQSKLSGVVAINVVLLTASLIVNRMVAAKKKSD
mmetsp:Transcript_13359/g.37487  ORF Transcript_13359/g.37487 Transcript_13359/m.37487 type:complete len:140 (-) Transcript_13359:1928-2347(-)